MSVAQPKPVPRLTPRQFRVCKALAQRRKLWREEIDSIAGASNGPEIMSQLKKKALEWTCERIKKIDRDGNQCEPGLYSIDDAGLETLARWGF
jgi:hypothetical protein